MEGAKGWEASGCIEAKKGWEAEGQVKARKKWRPQRGGRPEGN